MKNMEWNLYASATPAMIKKEASGLVAKNETTGRFGLSLSQEEAGELVESKNTTLRKYQRIELGESILGKLIEVFCDSPYLNQENYLPTLTRLQEVFYLYKNETQDELTDDELLTFMKEQFDHVCMGDTKYLAETCLERFAQAVRAGYRGYRGSGGENEYSRFDEETRWDKDLYMDVVKELFW